MQIRHATRADLQRVVESGHFARIGCTRNPGAETFPEGKMLVCWEYAAESVERALVSASPRVQYNDDHFGTGPGYVYVLI